jgi:hypothetical protein
MDLFMKTEEIKRALVTAKSHPWRASEHFQIQLLASWIAQACHAAAVAMLEAVTRQYGSNDYLPTPVAKVIEEMFLLGKTWEVNAQQALAGPSYQLDASLPVCLPNLSIAGADPSLVELTAVATLVETLKMYTDGLMGEVGYANFGDAQREFQPLSAAFEQEHKKYEAETASQLELWRGRPTGQLRQSLRTHLQQLAQAHLTLGQQLWMPKLFDKSFKMRHSVDPIDPLALARRLPTYNPRLGSTQDLVDKLKLGFDPWVLSDPQQRERLNYKPEALRALQAFWESDPEPAKTLAVHRQVVAAVEAGTTAYRTGEALKDCPWAVTCTALRTVTIAGERFGAGEIFAYQPGVVKGVFARQFMRLGRDNTVNSSSRLPSYQPGARQTEPAADSAIWFMTDPDVARKRAHDPMAVQQLRQLWSADPNPELTHRIWADVTAAVQAGTIQRRIGEALKNCPWPSCFVALRSLSVAGERIGAGEIFAVTSELQQGTMVRWVQRLGRDTTVAPPSNGPRPYQP